jgi:site-specific DNA-methyltransferase (adenine-specific)
MRLLIEISTLPGDSVLDPCCGSGATVLAAKACLRKALGIDLDKAATDAAIVKLAETELAIPPSALETQPDVSAL